MAISGFMVLRNAVSQGYPFIEAIAAALPICDEFLVSDGCSTDGTWEALQLVLEAVCPGKIRLFQDEWRGSTERGGVIATMTNVLKPRCRFDYCLNIQGNEIVHEAAAAQSRDLPTLYPEAEMFRLPFLTLLGTGLTWHADFRRRLFKNSRYIVSKADGYDCGYEPRLFWAQPRKLYRYILHRSGDQLIYLPKPIYRYRALFPKPYLIKLEEHCALYTRSTFMRRELEHARRICASTEANRTSPADFWAAMGTFFDDAMWSDCDGAAPPKHVPRRLMLFPGNPPQIMERLAGKSEYDVHSSLNALTNFLK
jgi:hypothetical protein